MSTLIIHRKVTSCQSSVKQPQVKMKIGIAIKINTTRSNMTFIFNSSAKQAQKKVKISIVININMTLSNIVYLI